MEAENEEESKMDYVPASLEILSQSLSNLREQLSSLNENQDIGVAEKATKINELSLGIATLIANIRSAAKDAAAKLTRPIQTQQKEIYQSLLEETNALQKQLVEAYKSYQASTDKSLNYLFGKIFDRLSETVQTLQQKQDGAQQRISGTKLQWNDYNFQKINQDFLNNITVFYNSNRQTFYAEKAIRQRIDDVYKFLNEAIFPLVIETNQETRKFDSDVGQKLIEETLKTCPSVWEFEAKLLYDLVDTYYTVTYSDDTWNAARKNGSEEEEVKSDFKLLP